MRHGHGDHLCPCNRQQVVAPATTLMLRLSTGFSTPSQKEEDVVLRLTGQGDTVTVGSFTICPRL